MARNSTAGMVHARAGRPEPVEQRPGAPEWTRMQRHIEVYLAGHPAMAGFRIVAHADSGGFTAELLYAGRKLRSGHARDDWWDPSTPARAREIADQLARDLHAQWLGLLRSA